MYLRIVFQAMLVATLLTITQAVNCFSQVQCPACPGLPDCPFDPWVSGQYSTTVTINNRDCGMTICYCARLACGRYYDVVITKIIPADASCLSIFSPSQIVQAVREKLAKDNPMDFPCHWCLSWESTEWRYFDGACYTGIDDNEELIPCSGATMCFQLYNVCCDQATGERFVVGPTQSGVAMDICDPSPEAHCYPTCPQIP